MQPEQASRYHLTDLPPELLVGVTTYLYHHSTSILNLWKCGNTIIRRNMRYGGVVALTLTDAYIAPHKVAIPSIVTELMHLNKLRLKSQHMVPEEKSLQLLTQLHSPTTLKHLALTFPNVDTILQPILAKYIELCYLQIQDPVITSKLFFPSFDLLPTQLHTLKLSHADIFTYMKSRQYTKDNVEVTVAVLFSACPNLRYLRLQHDDMCHFEFDRSHFGFALALPPTLTKVCVTPIEKARRPVFPELQRRVLPLPSSLGQLCTFIQGSACLKTWSTMTNLSTLHIKSATVATVYYELWSVLPRTLTELDVLWDFVTTTTSRKYSVEQFGALLPPGLERLATNLSLPVDLVNDPNYCQVPASFWPSTLSRLKMPVINALFQDYRIPPSVKYLNISGTDALTWHNAVDSWQFSQLYQLTHLTLGCFKLLLLPKMMPALVVSLQCLTFTIDINGIFEAKNMEEGVLNVFNRLPNGLKHLCVKMVNAAIPASTYRAWLKVLPPSLTCLKTNFWLPSDEDATVLASVIAFLPQQLRRLRLDLHHTTVANGAKAIIQRMHGIPFSSFPPNLEHLSVKGHIFSLRSLDVIMPNLCRLSIYRATSLAHDPLRFPKLQYENIRCIDKWYEHYIGELGIINLLEAEK